MKCQFSGTVQSTQGPHPYFSRVRCRHFLCGVVLSLCAPAHGSAQGRDAEVRVEQAYEWPGRAVLRMSLRQGELLVVSRTEFLPGMSPAPAGGGPVQAVCLPALTFGPLLARGLLRQIPDPLGVSAWSGVFGERTALVLDGALPPSRAGLLLTPFPGWGGLFCMPGRRGGTEYGAYGRLPLGRGFAAEGAALSSRPEPPPVTDEWMLPRGVFPGGEVVNFGLRLMMETPSLAFSWVTGGSSAQLAAPGFFSSLWISAEMTDLSGSVLISADTPGYRGPEGVCTQTASRFSGVLRFGRDRHRGTLEAGCSFAVAESPFSPGAEIPTKCVARAAFSREIDWAPGRTVSFLAQAEKDIGRDPDGVRTETSRCSSTACVTLGSADITAGAGCSDHDGARILGAVALRPSRGVRIGVEAGGSGLGAPRPAGNLSLTVAVESGGGHALLRAGVEDYPLSGFFSRAPAAPEKHLALSLSCSVRSP
jgi:hypothetical protein